MASYLCVWTPADAFSEIKKANLKGCVFVCVCVGVCSAFGRAPGGAKSPIMMNRDVNSMWKPLSP